MSALRWLKLPIWLAELATSAKSFRDNPIIGSEALNRRGLHVFRKKLACDLADWRRKRLARRLSQEDVAQFEENGFILKQKLLPEAEFAAVRREIYGYSGEMREMIQGNTVTRRILLDGRTLKDMPSVDRLLRSERWQGLMHYVSSYAMEPVYYIQVILTHVDGAPDDPQTVLHMDAFHPSMKAWLFMDEVEPHKGPFTYVPGSHRADAPRLAWEKQKSLTVAKGDDRLAARGSLRIQPEELAALGLPQARPLTVPGNSLVVGDTVGFHARGRSTEPSVRVELWAYARRNPYLPWLGLDVFSLPFIRGRQVRLFWWYLDLRHCLTGRGRPGRRCDAAASPNR
ncbi:phytanoyl-CoA dioxygenase family protein [Marinobacterium aestuariivivens]|uniref:Phytanoyl-CoA dioxygenase family protein n=1 Tax=Marinobacterium aestuariivivens TaxID=1698799 RepID=A0ABW1ZYV9_9GAMM